MNLNLYIFITYYLMIPMSIIGYGLFFFSLNKKLKITSNYGYTGLTGLLILCLYSYISSFFYEHDTKHNLVIILLGFSFFLYFNPKKIGQNQIYLSLFLLIYFVGMLMSKMHDDFPYYHFQYSYYLTQMPSALGIGNFNLGLRTQSSIFYLNSLFYLPITKYFMFHMSAFLIFLFSNMILLFKLIKDNLNKNFNYITIYYLLSFVFVNIFFYRISEHGTDRSAQILILILIGEILSFLNFKVELEKKLSKLFLLIALIISLKAFYVLYIIFFAIILYHLIKNYKFKIVIFYLFSNYYLYLFLILFFLVLSINFINTGCLMYPLNISCFDNFIWSISKIEVQELNNWYEQWAKGGAAPNFRIDNPEIYIQKLNWVSNWIDVYFFTKVSDFLLGIAFLSILTLFYFAPYKKKYKYKDKKITLTLSVISLLLVEWFYNHPTLRYGGYCLVASLVFIIISLQVEKSKHNFIKLKKKITYIIIFSLVIFVTRNTNRIFKEYKNYGYNPIKQVFYNIDETYFDLNKRMEILKINLASCKKSGEKCKNDGPYGVTKIMNMYVFFVK